MQNGSWSVKRGAWFVVSFTLHAPRFSLEARSREAASPVQWQQREIQMLTDSATGERSVRTSEVAPEGRRKEIGRSE